MCYYRKPVGTLHLEIQWHCMRSNLGLNSVFLTIFGHRSTLIFNCKQHFQSLFTLRGFS